MNEYSRYLFIGETLTGKKIRVCRSKWDCGFKGILRGNLWGYPIRGPYGKRVLVTRYRHEGE